MIGVRAWGGGVGLVTCSNDGKRCYCCICSQAGPVTSVMRVGGVDGEEKHIIVSVVQQYMAFVVGVLR